MKTKLITVGKLIKILKKKDKEKYVGYYTNGVVENLLIGNFTFFEKVPFYWLTENEREKKKWRGKIG